VCQGGECAGSGGDTFPAGGSEKRGKTEKGGERSHDFCTAEKNERGQGTCPTSNKGGRGTKATELVARSQGRRGEKKKNGILPL